MGASKAAAAVLCLVAGAAVAGAPAPAYADDAGSYLARLNAERTAHGLAPLKTSADLAAVAHGWAAHMAATGTLAHNPALSSAVTGWHAVGENVGDGPSITDLDAAFWASAPHRANILDPTYDDVGAGAVRRNGVIWISVVFRDDLASSSPTRGSSVAPDTAAPRPTVMTAPTTALLTVGSTGPQVQRVQRRLSVRADGVFGPVTHRAVVRFQRRHGLRVDGIVGPQTRAALRRAAHARHTAPPQPRWLGRLVLP